MALDRTPAGGAARLAASRLAPSTLGWGVAGATLALASLVIPVVLPPPLVLLGIACLLVTAGLGTAAALLLSGYRMGRDGTAAWDAASAMVFLGFAAGLLTDAGEAMTALAELAEIKPH